jgi:hypothetical protein
MVCVIILLGTIQSRLNSLAEHPATSQDANFIECLFTGLNEYMTSQLLQVTAVDNNRVVLTYYHPTSGYHSFTIPLRTFMSQNENRQPFRNL